MKPSGRGLLGMSSEVSVPVGVGRAVEMVDVRAAEGTESAILVTAGAEVTVELAAWVAEAWETGTEVATGTVELLEEPEGAATPEGEAEPEPEVELPVAGPEEPDEAPSQRAGPGIS